MVGAAFVLDAGGSASEAQGLGNFFRNLLSGTSEDPPPPSPGGFGRVDEAYCPAVDVFPGGAALQAYGGAQGDPHALRHQLSLVDFARECVTQPDGSVRVKVGVEGRALLGPAGSGGRFGWKEPPPAAITTTFVSNRSPPLVLRRKRSSGSRSSPVTISEKWKVGWNGLICSSRLSVSCWPVITGSAGMS